jgi:HAD superfamily hydrolase (TIGR01509 family)
MSNYCRRDANDALCDHTKGKLAAMAAFQNISAVIFDMDGTLVDSEIITAWAVTELCAECGIEDVDMDCSEFEGGSWEAIGEEIVNRYPTMKVTSGIAGRLNKIYHRMLVDTPPRVIRQARETVIAASERMQTAIVSSSHRKSIEQTIRQMNIGKFIHFYVGAEDCAEHKPAPDGFLEAAELMQVAPHECLVFEDSIPGLQAARNAGMQVVAVTQGRSNMNRHVALSDMTIADYADLEFDFFDRVGK